MKNNKIKMSLRIGALVLAGVLIGVTASARAAWTNPTATPPSGNADAPLNTGSTAQGRMGALSIGKTSPTSGVALDVVGNASVNTGGLAVGKSSPTSGVALDVNGSSVINSIGVFNLVVATGTPAAGKVLTSVDGVGTAGWQAPSLGVTPVTFGPYYSPSATEVVNVMGSTYSFCELAEYSTTQANHRKKKKKEGDGVWRLRHQKTDAVSVTCF